MEKVWEAMEVGQDLRVDSKETSEPPQGTAPMVCGAQQQGHVLDCVVVQQVDALTYRRAAHTTRPMGRVGLRVDFFNKPIHRQE